MVPPVYYMDDCNFLGTDIFDYEVDYINYWGFYLDFYDYDYNVTNVLKYYTETCAAGVFEFGDYHDSLRIIAQPPSDVSLTVGCAPSCETIIYDGRHCQGYIYAA